MNEKIRLRYFNSSNIRSLLERIVQVTNFFSSLTRRRSFIATTIWQLKKCTPEPDLLLQSEVAYLARPMQILPLHVYSNRK